MARGFGNGSAARYIPCVCGTALAASGFFMLRATAPPSVVFSHTDFGQALSQRAFEWHVAVKNASPRNRFNVDPGRLHLRAR